LLYLRGAGRSGRRAGQPKRSVMPSSAMPASDVLQVSPGFTGMARVRVPVVTISPAASGGWS
jgi:hypothetical protein